MHFIAHSHVCSEVFSWLHSIAHSQPAWLYAPNCSRWHTPSLPDSRTQVSSQDAPKYSPSTLSSTLPIALDNTLPACLTIRSEVSSQGAPKDIPNTFSSILPGMLSSTLPIALDGTLPACLTVRSQVSSQDAPKYSPSTLSSTLPIALDNTLPACLTIRSHVSSKDALNNTPEHALKYTPNRTWWHTPILLECTLPSKLWRHSEEYLRVRTQVHPRVGRKFTLKREDTRNLTWLYAPMYAPAYSIQRLAELQTPGTGRSEAGGIWRA